MAAPFTGWAVRLQSLLLVSAAMLAMQARAENVYDPGASDTEIKIGNIMAYTGWAAAYGSVGRAEAAYFAMVNDRGGVNGRKLAFVSLDSRSASDGAMELARRLVEDEKVLLVFSPLGTETNLAIRAYLNDKHVPQLFVESSSRQFNDPASFPWTMGFFPTFYSEGAAYAKYILQVKAAAKIAILRADDSAGREYEAGVRSGLGSRAGAMIVEAAAYQIPDPALDSKIAALKASGADVFLNLAVGPFATRAIRAANGIDWHPLQFITNASLSTAAFLEPAGLEKAAGIISNARSKGWLEPEARADPAVSDFLEWMAKYDPQANPRDQNNVAGYERAEALVELLRHCGGNLTRANVMHQAANLNLDLGMLRPGIKVKTSAADFQPIHQLFLMKFDGREWVPFGSPIGD